MKPDSFTKGQSVLEVIIALAIIAMSISAAIAISFGSRFLVTDAELNNRAIYLTKEILEQTRAAAKNNFSSLVSSSSTEDIYLKEIIVQDIDSYTKKIISRLSWEIDPLRPQRVEFTALVTDWELVLASGGDTGGGGLSGNWASPKTLGSINLGAGVSATDLDALNKMVYITSQASDPKKSDFFVVDATDGQNPAIVSELNTGAGLNAVDVAGSFAYAANNDVNAQLQIIDVADMASPTLIKSFKIPGVSGSGAVGSSIFFLNSKIYIGTKKAVGPEFHVIDVSSPTNPVAIGNWEFNADIGAIYVSDNIAYVANSADEELAILNVADPSNIALLNRFDAPGDSEDGKSLFLVGRKLYLGRTAGGNHANHHEFHIIDVSSSTSPRNLGSKDLGADLNDLVVRDNLAFFATSNPNQEFQVWDISNPDNIALVSSFNFPQMATGIDYENNLVYVSVRSNDALRIITSNPD